MKAMQKTQQTVFLRLGLNLAYCLNVMLGE